MNSLATDIKQLIAKRLDVASPSEVLAIASQLAGANDNVVVLTEPRFTNLGADGRPTTGADWVAVYDAKTNLTWTRGNVPGGRREWADAMKAASEVRLFGKADWRAPTIQEQLSIVEYGRIEPALDPAHFDGKDEWVWTSTPAAGLSGCAWSVGLLNGNSYRGNLTYEGIVRAVRAGQSLGL